MIERLQAVLEEMDGWLTKAASEETTHVPKDELIQWHITLTALYDEWDKLQEAAQSAVDAFLLRPSRTESPVESRRPASQRLYQRLAAAMAELEQVLVELKSNTDPS